MNLVQHLEKLRYFYEVAKLGSMKKASTSIYISQPSLTKSIKNLEEVIGAPLFVRMPRGVQLTHEGEILNQFCHTLFSSITNLEQKLQHPSDSMAGSLKVGTYDSIGIYFWPKFLKSFLPHYPGLKFELETGRSAQIQEKLEQGELDLILVIEPKAKEHINVEVLRKDNFKLFISTKSKRTFKSESIAPIIYMPSALAGKTNLQQMIESLDTIKKRNFYTTTSLESVRELTINGIGIGLLPRMVAKDCVEKNKLQEIKIQNFSSKKIGEHSIGIAYRKSKQKSLLIQTLVNQIKKSPLL